MDLNHMWQLEFAFIGLSLLLDLGITTRGALGNWVDSLGLSGTFCGRTLWAPGGGVALA